MIKFRRNLTFFFIFINFLFYNINAQVLNPPYFNIAEGRKIVASATCGEGINIKRELYCRLDGSSIGYDQQSLSSGKFIKGQHCDYCDSNDPFKSHKAEYITDGTGRWWQSPPLSRDLNLTYVTLTLDLNQEFHIAYILLKMGNSPRPDIWVLERSIDLGKTWKPWQYFAPTKDLCIKFFGEDSILPITRDDSVTCETKFSNILPLENGEITVKLLNDRPGSTNFTTSSTLQEWSKATNIRLRFLRPKTTLEDLIEGYRKDPSVTRRYFYSLKDMNIGGRCVCNGHAETCNILDSTEPFKLYCQCKHNTTGIKCEYCREGYVQKKWRPSTVEDHFHCEKCNCFNHSKTCYYDEEVDKQNKSLDLNNNYSGGGVCKNCQDNTSGINCNQCIEGYYQRPNTTLSSKNICAKCDCDMHYHTGRCADETGICECKENFQSPNCQKCSFGYYGPLCKPCECYVNGTKNFQCKLKEENQAEKADLDKKQTDLNDLNSNDIAKCDCKENYTGRYCRECSKKYFNFPNCTSCSCEMKGALDEVCNQTTGKCNCKNSFGGTRCEECDTGYFFYPECSKCDCDVIGSTNEICDKNTGKCFCKNGYYGKYCDSCAPNYYGYPNCQPCNCYEPGSLTTLCLAGGKCTCLSNYDGQKCSKCKPGFYNDTSVNSCVPCNCDTIGSLGVTCNADGKCFCRENFDGEKCNVCKKDFFNYPMCERCDCNPNGIEPLFAGCKLFSTVQKLCDCKSNVIGRKCNQCKNLYWKLNKFNPSGCQDCQCNTNATISNLGHCHGVTGQCNCKANIIGRTCNECRDGYFDADENNFFGCKSCDCSPYGSDHFICIKNTGQCRCKPKVYGRTCDRPAKIHYFPTLYQFQYEIENGLTPQNTLARYDYNESIFLPFSWKGFVNFDDIQKEIILNVLIEQTSIYKTVFHYKNPSSEPVTGSIKLTRNDTQNPYKQEQKVNLVFEPTGNNTKKYLPVGKIGTNSIFFLKSGEWEASLTIDKPLLVDYVVFLPEEYWNAQNFFEYNEKPCLLLQDQEANNLCKQFAYPTYPTKSTLLSNTKDFKLYENYELLDKLLLDKANKNVAILNNHDQSKLKYRFQPKTTANHVLILVYHNLDLTPTDHILDKKYRTFKFTLKQQSFKRSTDYNTQISSENSTKIDLSLLNNLDYKLSNDNTTYLTLNDCPYSFVCKQIVVATDSDYAIFNLDQNNNYELKVEVDDIEDVKKNIAAAIELVFIPIDQFSLDHVKGELVCNQNINKKCQRNHFISNHNYTKLDLIDRTEDSNKNLNIETIAPLKSILNPNNQLNLSEYMLINTETLSNIAQGNVTEPKLYTFVVEYYQPLNANFEVDSTISLNNGNTYLNKIFINYCPNINGCRTQILTLTNGTLFELADSFDLAMKVPLERSFYLKKIMLFKNENFSPNILHSEPQKTSELDFIKNCAQDAYYVDADLYNKYWNQTTNNFENILVEDQNKISKFCRDTIFGLTIKFNKGAILCRCNSHGSLSHECAQFGGQCKCKRNIIGRTCSMCKTGYYGFPDCKPCNCPSTANCEPKTGKCVCPPRVTGAKCEKCTDLTWGYHRLNGCDECKCNNQGVENNNLQCDTYTGKCECKKNIGGRRCNYCVNGFYMFPICILCSCDASGATEKICDTNTGKCFCKPNVIGESCEQCKTDSFNLDENNPMGCSKCWCSGVSTKCRSSDLVYVKHIDMNYQFDENDQKVGFIWATLKLLFKSERNIEEHVLYDKLIFDDNKIRLALASIQQDTENEDTEILYNYYLSLPKSYLGKKIDSYGGKLSYSLTHDLNNDHKNMNSVPDVILRGNNRTILHEVQSKPVPNKLFLVSLPLTEKSFKNLDGSPVAREQFMMILMNISSILIKATYFNSANEVSFEEITLDIGTRNDTLKQNSTNVALNVEKCFCPRGYTGNSCEKCDSGYYRAKVGPYLGYCVPCKCNQHSQECDVETGKCLNCKHNTTGDYCELCGKGFYGNAETGSVDDCLICPCPLPIESNNFGINCTLDQSLSMINYNFKDRFKCNCKPGYRGKRCEKCEIGFYGQPDIQNNYCKQCNCSGNANLTEEGVCDPINGKCLMCENNTYGDFCEICAPNYYGDAIHEKNCKSCSCSKCGTINCDNKTGICNCKKNIIGDHCDQCADNHWGYNQCSGCIACNCGKASNSSQCDLNTGTCSCKQGVTGQQCDRCESGYWNYTLNGCTSCNCTKEFSYGSVCNEKGQCKCLPGVLGEKCDRCPYRWVFIPNVGCRKCENCVHGLLDSTDKLTSILESVMSEMVDSSSSVLENRKLSRVNDTVVKFKNRLAQLIDQSVKDDKHNSLTLLENVKTEADNLESLSKKLIDQKQNLIDTSKQLLNETWNCSMNLKNQHLEINNVKSKLNEKIKWIKSLIYTLTPLKTNEESILQKGQRIVSQIKLINLTDDYKNILDQFNETNIVNKKVLEFEKPWLKTKDEIDEIFTKLNLFNNLLKDLEFRIQESSLNTVQFDQSNFSLTNVYKDIIINNKKIATLNDTINEALKKAIELNQASEGLLKEDLFKNEDREQYEELKKKYDDLNSQRKILNESIDFLTKSVEEAVKHSNNLHNQSSELIKLFYPTKNYSDVSIKAANSYLEMTKAIDNSLSFIENALDVIKEIKKISFKKQSPESFKSISYDVKNKAAQIEVKVNNELGINLNNSLKQLIQTGNDLNDSYELQKQFRAELLKFPNQKIRDKSKKTIKLSEDANNLIDESFKNLEKKINDLHNISSYKDEMKNRYLALNQANKSSFQYYERLENFIPHLKTKLDEIIKIQSSINTIQNTSKTGFNALKKAIKTARATANRIDLGLKIKPNTYVELRTPENLLKPGTYTKFSFDFRSQVNNGFLAYLGNPKSIKTSVNNDYHQKQILNDYLALEIRDKRVTLIIEIGGTPLVVINPMQIKKNVWYFVEIEIIGKHISLKIKSANEKENVVNSHIDGTFSVFDLDVRDSKLFIGGIPKTIELQDKIENNKFHGGVQNVNLNDVKLGVWNFINGNDNYEGDIKNSTVAADEYSSVKFNGKGYIVMDRSRRYNFKRQTSLILSFKTLSEYGLIFLIKGEDNFLAIQILDGKLNVVMDLGNEPVKISSIDKVNNNRWHKLELNRLDKEIMVKLNSVEIGVVYSKSRNNYLETDNFIYFGGYNKELKTFDLITESNFNGCLRSIQLEAFLINLEKDALEIQPGIEFGCLDIVLREISFEQPGYITMPLVNEINQISFKFRTKEKNALLFYASNKINTEHLALYLKDSSLIFDSEPGERINTSITSSRNFNDNKWHYLTATRTNLLMRLDLDDKFNYKPEKIINARTTINNYKSLNLNDDLVYFGGIQAKKQSILENIDIPTSLIGCLGDVNLNEAFQNFALSQNKVNVQLVSCVQDEMDNLPGEDKVINKYITDQPHMNPSSESTIIQPNSNNEHLSLEENINSSSQTTSEIPFSTQETTTVLNLPIEGCKLPIIPNNSNNLQSISLRFEENSRHEIFISDEIIKNLEDSSKFSFKFKTSSQNGLLFYVGNTKVIDYVLVYLTNGAISYAFNCGYGSVTLTSDEIYNDDNWHSVTVRRDKKIGYLIIDEEEKKTGISPGKGYKLNLNSPIYIGGLPESLFITVGSKMKTSYEPFNGYIGQIQLLDVEQDLTLGQFIGSVEKYSSENKETGVFFTGRGYIKSKNIFEIENEIKISMQIKPRNINGIILYIGSINDNHFLLLEIVDGTLKVSVMNGEKPFTGEIKKDVNNLCDGEWHSIQVVKMANVVILFLDKNTTGPIIQNSEYKITKTDSVLYIGGHHIGGIGDKDATKWNAPTFTNYFAGCIKDFKIESKNYEDYAKYLYSDPFTNIAYGEVKLDGGCPTN